MGSYLQSASQFTSGAGATQPVTWVTANLTPGSFLVADCFWESNTQTCAVADPTNGAWTPLGSPKVGTGALAGWSSQSFVLAGNTSNVTPTVTMTTSGSNSFRALAIHEYSGPTVVKQTAAYTNVNSGTPASASLTPTGAADIAHSFCNTGSAAVNSVSAGFTPRETTTFASNMTADDTALTVGVAVAATYTCATSNDNTLGILLIGVPDVAPAASVGSFSTHLGGRGAC